MKLTAEEVISMQRKLRNDMPIDKDILNKAIESFDYVPSIDAVLCRYCDIIDGSTTVKNGEVTLTLNSSASELDISYDLYQKCVLHSILTIADVNKERCMQFFTLEDCVEILAAMAELLSSPKFCGEC